MLIYFNIILTHGGWIAKNMNTHNSIVIDELKLVQKRMDRLREGFRLEKESSLEDSNLHDLEKLRERSKSIYQMEVAECSREIVRLKLLISADEPGMEEADDLSDHCKREAASLLAHLVSAPNRLIRIYKAGGLRKKKNDI